MSDIRGFSPGLFGAGALSLALAFGSGIAFAEPDTTQERALLAKYSAIKPRLEKNQFGAPISVESSETERSVRVDMYGLVNYPFESVKDALQSPAQWCQIAPLHINIKACTFGFAAGKSLLTLYSGRKYYQPPSDAYPLKFVFRAVSQAKFLEVTLQADKGPLGTKDHRILLQATPLDGQRTLLRFSSTYSHGSMARLAIGSYFATVGQDKVGFSQLGDDDGKTYFVGGVRGAVERNAMRYYLALQSYLETMRYPESQRFEARIGRWYDLTAKYPRQLKEIDKKSYLGNKRMERKKQIALQKQSAG